MSKGLESERQALEATKIFLILFICMLGRKLYTEKSSTVDFIIFCENIVDSYNMRTCYDKSTFNICKKYI